MEPTHTNPPAPETPLTYYNAKRKRSFLFSRLFVFLSMLVLLIALSINVSILYTGERTSTTTQASNSQTELPTLPKECNYESNSNGKNIKVICPSISPLTSKAPVKASDSASALTVGLPNLPSQCRYLLTQNGYEVKCASSEPPIPTVAVAVPVGCEMTTSGPEGGALVCQDGNSSTPLPNLPKGCTYAAVGVNYFVRCVAR